MPETNFFWDPVEDNIIQERDETGAITAEYATEPYLYGNLISQNRGGVESQYHFDSQGSTLALTDDNQQVTDTYAYSAFGEVTEHTGSTENPFQFVGQKCYYRDAITNDYQARRRQLAAACGRWLSHDPIDLLEASYVYVKNSPLSHIDPSGLAALCNARTCTTDMIIPGEGIYGLYAEVVAGRNPCCATKDSSCGSINFTYIETHEPPPNNWPHPEKVGKDGCLQPANKEITNNPPKSWKYGNILDRKCSAPKVTSSKSPKGCWTVILTWSCPVTCRENGALQPTSPWLGIYSKNWGKGGGPLTDLPGAILLQPQIKYEQDACCCLKNCAISTNLFTLDYFNTSLPPGWRGKWPPEREHLPPGVIPHDQKFDDGVDLDVTWPFIGTPRKDNCTKDLSNYLWNKAKMSK